MTKFVEMCEARAQCTRAWIEYRDRSYKSLITLTEGFVVRCQIPTDSLSLAPLDKEPQPGTSYGPAGAIHFDSTDLYWHLGLILTLTEDKNSFPVPRALLEMAVREQSGKLLVKRGKGDKPQEIDLTDKKQCDDFYDSIAERVKRFYAASPENISDDTTVRKIGFAAD
jgi:hypothetical protein